MFKVTEEYIDYRGNEKKEDFYFHLNKAELMDMEMSTIGGFTQWVQDLIDANDLPTIKDIFKKVLHASYGKRTVNGGFVKRAEDLEEFISSEAYSQIFMRLITDADYAVKFMNGLIAEVKKVTNPIPAPSEK